MENLTEWRKDINRMPLILQGVRQCGKTYLVKEFGGLYYKNIVVVNFEDKNEYKSIFDDDLDPRRIIKRLSLEFSAEINPENTLIFFDEIQLCGRAVTSLKYFCENAPEYHIIAAGSLLGVALAEKTSFPVGKVQRLTLRPMNFEEFLLANNKENWVEHIKQGGDQSPLERQLKQYLQEYYITGGMPSCIKIWIETGSIEKLEQTQDALLADYENDFAKHAPKTEYPKLTAVWHSIPMQLAKENRKFIFSRVKDSWRAKDLEDALQWLISAGLVHKVKLIEKPGFPLAAYADENYFKLYLCDVGLLRKLAGVPANIVFNNEPQYKEFKGAAAENYVLTEIQKSYDRAYYWKSNNTAEVDFIIQDEDNIVPVEVKAQKASHAKSLTVYCQKYKPKKSLLTAMETKDLPLYLMWRLKDWLREN
ncbi:MAG: ATP-binding protein [Oscillospiraceae bacterium]|nr:ATP-binding protein [Oscillospiraceae bacterium]